MNIKEGKYRMFEIYAKEYKKVMQEKDQKKINRLEEKMNTIDKELTNYTKEFCKLDLEFKENSNEIPDPIKYYMENGTTLNPHNYVNNTKWEGFWKKCSGKDLEYFISYLEYPIMYPKHEIYVDNNKNLIEVFKNETGINKTPYGVICAEIINKKYFK
ncbi:MULTISPECIES: hypothetical protein [Clostridia]|uniref:hypothetical protein n=1 Tax=Clostridium sp. CCUG 7971 TaxID=2811414 RepID=UPI001ABAAA67|nr:hypothetical protein [Clostridium sp. CCUG 7971]MBO3444702.1 hypothetical protein [Clostridium sp. CCUG 7971]